MTRRYQNRNEWTRSEEHTSELQSRLHLVCRLLLEKKKKLVYTKWYCTLPPQRPTIAPSLTPPLLPVAHHPASSTYSKIPRTRRLTHSLDTTTRVHSWEHRDAT